MKQDIEFKCYQKKFILYDKKHLLHTQFTFVNVKIYKFIFDKCWSYLSFNKRIIVFFYLIFYLMIK